MPSAHPKVGRSKCKKKDYQLTEGECKSYLLSSMAEAAGLVLSVLGLLPILTSAFQSIRDTCAGIVANEHTCGLLVADCDHIERAVRAAVNSLALLRNDNAFENSAQIRAVLEEVKYLIK